MVTVTADVMGITAPLVTQLMVDMVAALHPFAADP